MKGLPPNPALRRWLVTCGVLLGSVGVTVLLGRFTGLTWLVTLVPDGAPMAFVTALGFLVGGGAFVGYGRERPELGRSAAALLVLFGGGTLLLYALAGPLGWERWAYDPQQPVVASGVGLDGRMSPSAALSFALLGAGLLLLGAPRLRSRLAAGCIAVLLAIALIAIVSYLTGLHFSVGWWRYTALGVPTATAFLVAAAGLLLWLMQRMAVADRAVTRTVPFFVVAVTAVIMLGAIVLVSNTQRLEGTRWMNRSLEVEAAIDRFIASVARLESATRAFGVTGDESYLDRIDVHRTSVSDAVAALVRLTGDNPSQHARALSLEPLIEEKFRVNDAQVRARREGGVAAAAATLRAEPPELMAGLRAATGGLQTEEQRVVLRRRADTTINETRLQGVLLLGGLLTVGLVGVAFALVHRAQRELTGVNDQLEARVRQRTAELEASTAQLRESEQRLEVRVAERTAELRVSEERFRQAFEFAGIGMAIVGLDGRWVRVNTSICEIVGYSPPELLQKTFQDITHPDDLEADLAHVHELIAGTRRSYQMEKRYFHRDGHVVWVRLTVSIVRDARDRPVHFVSQIEDITEHKRLQQHLANARDQALEASRLKSEFLATMSHEIRTPMNGVIGMTTLLRDTPLTSAQAEYVRTIETSGESLLTIINDILDYSKIEAGRMELEVAPFDLRQCIDEVIDLFAGRAAEKRLNVLARLAPGVPTHVAGDATRLRQVLVNLLGNALKFTERGEVVVAVEVEPVEQRHRLGFAVQDTGIGIPPAAMGRLFKSFSQVDASTTRRFGGTGLGLAISKRLVELMGGEMTVESVVGQGSTFRFSVQVERAPVPAAVRRTTGAAGRSSAPFSNPPLDATLGQRCPLRVLIAEDNLVNQRVAGLLLQRLGYQATTVVNGLEALAALDAANYDVILMDVDMPELDGCEATRRIRATRPAPTRPWIIALTAGAMQSDRDRALGAGMNDFLTKPVRADELAGALERAFEAGAEGAGG